jgi:poly(3-hydroxybutyrate) depolymerase
LNHYSRETRVRRHAALSRFFGLIAGAIIAAALSAASMPAHAYNFDQSQPATAAAGVLTTNSAGCGKKAGNHGLFNLYTQDGNRTNRKYLIEVPADYQPTKAYSLNFVFHGAGANSAQSYSWGLQNVAGASENGIFVFPDGVRYLNYGIGWDDASNGYDLPFFDNMVKYVEANYCINTARVFVAGFSWGGDFVTSLVCNRGNKIRAAAANSTTDEFTDSDDFMSYQNLPCPSTTRPAVRFEHAAGGDSQYPAPNFANTSKLFQHLNSCATTSKAVASSTNSMSCASYNSCAKEFIECAFNSSIGHALPPNWAKDTWAFFSSFN